MERFGFTHVSDFVLGIDHWGAYGLPLVGRAAYGRTVRDLIAKDVPRCAASLAIGDARSVLAGAGESQCVVVDQGGVAVGILDSDAPEDDPDTPVSLVMANVGQTVRPNAKCAEARRLLQGQASNRLLVTNPEGVLVGVVHRSDLDSASTC